MRLGRGVTEVGEPVNVGVEVKARCLPDRGLCWSWLPLGIGCIVMMQELIQGEKASGYILGCAPQREWMRRREAVVLQGIAASSQRGVWPKPRDSARCVGTKGARSQEEIGCVWNEKLDMGKLRLGALRAPGPSFFRNDIT